MLNRFRGDVWVKRKGLAAAASANPSSFMVAGAIWYLATYSSALRRYSPLMEQMNQRPAKFYERQAGKELIARSARLGRKPGGMPA